MSNGQIIRLIPLTAAQLSDNSHDAAFPAGNLADPQPKVVWQYTGAAGFITITVDLGADTLFDTVGLLYTNATSTATLAIRAATAAQGLGDLINHPLGGNVPMRPPVSSLATRVHAVQQFAPLTARYLRYDILFGNDQPGNVINAGIAAIGQTWASAFNFELGAGRKVEDLSTRRILDGGEIASWKKAKVPLFQATWSNIADAELLVLWSQLLEIGETEPLLLIENPDLTAGLNERIHYCVMDSAPDFYSREQDGKSRIVLKVRDWL